MRISIICLIIQILIFGVNGVNLQMGSELEGLGKKFKKYRKRKAEEKKLKKRLRKQMKKDYRKSLRNEMDKLRDEDARDQGVSLDTYQNPMKGWRDNGYGYSHAERSYGEHGHNNPDESVKKLVSDLEHKVLDDFRRFENRLEAY